MKFRRARIPGKMLVELGSGEALPAGANEESTPRFQLKNILVPIDFSECSKKAIVYALPYAQEFRAKITLLYVANFHYATSEGGSAEAVVSEQQHIERAKIELLNLARELPSCLETKTAVVAGKPFEEIVATAEVLNADLIIIGTHGAMGQRHEILGSTAERVARYANCPVLIVRERERDFVSTNRAGKTGGKLSVGGSAI